MTLDAAFHLFEPQFPWLQSGLYTNRGPGVSGERDTSVALGRNPQKANPGPCQNSLGCEGQRGRWMLSSSSSVLRRERRKEGDNLRGSQRRRVQTSEAELDPNRAHTVPRGLGTGRGAGGRTERARRGGAQRRPTARTRGLPHGHRSIAHRGATPGRTAPRALRPQWWRRSLT